jgi:hypothetical protein
VLTRISGESGLVSNLQCGDPGILLKYQITSLGCMSPTVVTIEAGMACTGCTTIGG